VLLTHLHSDHISDLNDVVTTHWVLSTEATPLPVYGPPGTKQVVDGLLDMLSLDEGYRRAHHPDLDYPPGVSVTEVEPGTNFTVAGADVSVYETDHRPVAPTVGYRVEHSGTAAALAGDTVPCAGLDQLCTDADIYVQTVLREDLVRAVPRERFQDILGYHSTVEQAAQTAARAKVVRLVLTHCIPEVWPGQEDDWRARAAQHFDGEIVIGPDLTTITA
jgi:ribonuclease Z